MHVSKKVRAAMRGGRICSRNEEVNKSILKDEVRKVAAALHGNTCCASAGEAELPDVEEEDNQIENHRINECGGKNCVVRLGDETCRELW